MSTTRRRRAIDAAVRRLNDLQWRQMPPEQIAEELVDAIFSTGGGGVQTRMVQLLSQATAQDASLNQGRLRKLAADLTSAGYLPDDIFRGYIAQGCPWSKDWRSRRGTQPASERDIRATISLYAAQVAGGDEIEIA